MRPGKLGKPGKVPSTAPARPLYPCGTSTSIMDKPQEENHLNRVMMDEVVLLVPFVSLPLYGTTIAGGCEFQLFDCVVVETGVHKFVEADDGRVPYRIT